MKTITVSVTQEDIEQGTQDDCTSCPIALALNRLLAGKYTAWVQNACVEIYLIGSEASYSLPYSLPKEAQQFVADFDAAGQAVVKPFSFELNVDERYLATEV